MSLDSVFARFHQHTRGDGENYSAVAKFSTKDLLQMHSDLDNLATAGMASIRAAGALISGYDNEDRGGFDCNNSGWLVMHVAEIHEAVTNLQWAVEQELIRRGYATAEQRIEGARHVK